MEEVYFYLSKLYRVLESVFRLTVWLQKTHAGTRYFFLAGTHWF